MKIAGSCYQPPLTSNHNCYNKPDGADLILKTKNGFCSQLALESCTILKGDIPNYQGSSSINAYSSNVNWWYTRGNFFVTILSLYHQIVKLIIEVYCPDDSLELCLSISSNVVPYKCGIISPLDVTWVVWLFCEAYSFLLKKIKQTVTCKRKSKLTIIEFWVFRTQNFRFRPLLVVSGCQFPIHVWYW